ncbi:MULTISPECIES: exodeoxyribonuclease V subunit gamma [unclassified Halorhodospira]|uniref:exodeoxyribonuclease V subunit gamma n=1 Tax=unclassified Halorhodospira TaxID=2626748 RepID=UPI001EE876A5|nr:MULTISPECIES: exodeoxyribonuclease V subunit gamma [unclassified Halorhodospira]MCG5539855.1 exodeoxyribonuclease V subunit gamma [Halorhodospira sp. M39old]MCG5544695.1 exodeoxyribonuclease V subunit gamma [Halorhodospira sp. M38]
MAAEEPIEPGFLTIHGNRLEDLRQVAVEWVQRHPLAPLEDEVFLVQSNGMAQWLRLALARHPEAEQGGCGIAASVSMQLPARFLWSVYRAVLGPEGAPRESPFGKDPLLWRLARLLPALGDQPGFEPLRGFLADDPDGRKRYQLAARIADLFDQYQVYRADWLADWSRGEDVCRDARGKARDLAETQRWQASLWRAVCAELAEVAGEAGQATVHQLYRERIASLDTAPAGLPRRVIVFGISSLPRQTLEALQELSRFAQVLVFVHNPCAFYWADIIADKDLLRAGPGRRPRKAGMPEVLEAEELHNHAHPLLAAWGKQGRDYIGLLDAHEDPQAHPHRALAQAGERIDLFRGPETGSLLGQLQDDILQLRPLAETREVWPAVGREDASLQFHLAHSAQREVEVLHDRLLAAFSEDASLRPRDVIVMVPDIDAYAPHIEAVFGRFDAGDARHIPYTVADQGERGLDPLLIAVEQLLSLPESRCGLSDLLDLLEAPALRRRFGITEADLATLHGWAEEAGVRWGLNRDQRAGLQLPQGLEQNTWRFGLRRMLLGYAVGAGEAWSGVEPYAQVGGLDAALVGRLERLVGALEATWGELRAEATPQQWGERLQRLLETYFEPSGEAESLTLERLRDALEKWQRDCESGAFAEPLPLNVVREHWLQALEDTRLSQRFLVGAVNFCTLMPMRAIPFRHVCLLGMNDGDYPRSPTPLDFDLMADDYRPGDRSRREDDRYLFLEALLSARDRLYISWIGRSVRDNEPRPPSVLVGQLRDHLAAGWRLADDEHGGGLLEALTVEHPLQPFSRQNFQTDPSARHYTYAREWWAAHQGDESESEPLVTTLPERPVEEPPAPVTPETLGALLKQPVKTFFNRRLGVHFDDDPLASEDQEPFGLDGLTRWQMREALFLAGREAAGDPEARRERLAAEAQRLQRTGALPLGPAGTVWAETLQLEADEQLERYHRHLATFAQELEPLQRLTHRHGDWQLEGGVDGIRSDGQRRVRLTHHLSRLAVNRREVRWRFDLLAAPWVTHLMANAAGEPLTTVIVGHDLDVALAPLEPGQAGEHLSQLLAGWAQAQRRPLPVPCQPTCAWLTAQDEERGDPAAAAERVYVGDNYTWAAADAHDLRAFPRAADWLEDEGFPVWREALYAPLLRAVQAYTEDGDGHG